MKATGRAAEVAGHEEDDGLFWSQTRSGGESGGTVEWLWDAGAASGVCRDRDTALEQAEMFATPESEAWVEKAITVASTGTERMWMRTGTVHVGRLGQNGIRQWSQALLALPPEGTCRA